MVDRVGQQLGNYRLIRLLGRGGFAEVYLGEHVRLGTHTAVKVLYTRLANSDDVESFQKEARTIAHLEHPHIVRVFDFDVIDDTPFLVMNYAPNGTLRQRYPKGSVLPLKTIESYIKQIAEALEFAHDQRLIHRDVKPENMLLGRRDELLLSDFGIAILAQSSRYQSTQDMAGTMAYMAPEQIQGKPRPASDQYSLGIVVYEWLSGDRPFHGSLTEIVAQHLAVSPPSLHEKDPTISHEVEQVVMTALAKDPKQRFGSVQAFATALEQANQVATIQPVALPTEIYLSNPTLLPDDTVAATSLSQSVLPAEATTPPSPQSEPPGAATVVSASMPAKARSTAQREETFYISNSRKTEKTATEPNTKNGTNIIGHQRRPSKSRITLLIGLLVIVLGTSTGIYYFAQTNLRTTGGFSATAIVGTTATADAKDKMATTQAYASSTPALEVQKQEEYTRIMSMTPALSDPLNDNSNGFWNGVGQCSFINGAFHVYTVTPASNSSCRTQNPIVGQFYAFQVQMTIVKGSAGGIIGGFLLLNGDKQNYGNAIFIGLDGSYAFCRICGFSGENPPPKPNLTTSHTSTLHEGLGQTNQITVIDGGNGLNPDEFDLFINGHYVDTTTAGISFPTNFLVFLVSSNTSALIEVAYSHAKLWNNI